MCECNLTRGRTLSNKDRKRRNKWINSHIVWHFAPFPPFSSLFPVSFPFSLPWKFPLIKQQQNTESLHAAAGKLPAADKWTCHLSVFCFFCLIFLLSVFKNRNCSLDQSDVKSLYCKRSCCITECQMMHTQKLDCTLLYVMLYATCVVWLCIAAKHKLCYSSLFT